METYIHPSDEKIKKIIQKLELVNKDLKEIIHVIFKWFDSNVKYSRLNAPFYPLQRSDLDVLDMLSGTCGDYSNLLVSVLIALEYESRYAYVKVDCYNNPQDHICAAVLHNNKWILIDATLPYRRWHGYDCQHKEYELLSVEEFLVRMKKEESYWTEKAVVSGDDKYAGLFYAPWIHEDVIEDTTEKLESVFYLLTFENKDKYQIFVTYLVYSKENAFSPVMCRITSDAIYYSFSEKKVDNIWDSEQWGQEYLETIVPKVYKGQYYEKIKRSICLNIPIIRERIL